MLRSSTFYKQSVSITFRIIVIFYQMLGLSYLRYPFTAEDSLVSDVMIRFCSDEETNTTTSLMASEFKAYNLNFG